MDPENYFYKYLRIPTSNPYSAIGLNTISATMFHTDLFPDLVYKINGNFFNRLMSPIPRESVNEVVFKKDDIAFLKLEYSTFGGEGVSRIDRNRFSIDLLDQLGNFVIQSPVAQHPILETLSPRAAATLRIYTVNANGAGSEFRAAYLRLGRLADDAIKVDSVMRVAVDMKTGALYSEGTDVDWTRIDRHPDTGARFAGTVIPAFDKVVRNCLVLHDRVPHVRLAGWDACVTPDEELVLFEVNVMNPDLKFSEAAMGPIFAGLGWDSAHKLKHA